MSDDAAPLNLVSMDILWRVSEDGWRKFSDGGGGTPPPYYIFNPVRHPQTLEERPNSLGTINAMGRYIDWLKECFGTPLAVVE